jgi:hypothetical protein
LENDSAFKVALIKITFKSGLCEKNQYNVSGWNECSHVGQEIFDNGEDEITENVLFVDFIDDNVRNVLQARVRLEKLQQNSSRAEQNAAFRSRNCTEKLTKYWF